MAPGDLDPSSSVFLETVGKGMSYNRLNRRKILVVGAGQQDIGEENSPIGNGRAIAVLCAREGAAVVCLDVNKKAADETVEQIRKEGGEAYPYVFDVRNTKDISKAVDGAKKLLGGRLDGLVLGVGISRGLPLFKITQESWDDEFAVNLRSHMLFAQSALQVMHDGASIVLLSSMAGYTAIGNPAYEASKAAQRALGRALAKMGEPKGIRANVVAPGYVDTPLGQCKWLQGLRHEVVDTNGRQDVWLQGTERAERTWCHLAGKLQGKQFSNILVANKY
jgi:NAD(P)-dependent dehydrogenase (short-subunit alcohol dehydrogenase family)